MIAKSEHTPPSLVGLVLGNDGCYLYGDDEKKLVYVTPIKPLAMSIHTPVSIPYSGLVEMLELADFRPEKANAFYLGSPVFRYTPHFRWFDSGVQYCVIQAEEWVRSQNLVKPDILFPDYFGTDVQKS